MDYGVWKGKRFIGKSLAVGGKGCVITEGPYGDHAEELIVVTVVIHRRNITGTDITKMLKTKGYYVP